MSRNAGNRRSGGGGGARVRDRSPPTRGNNSKNGGGGGADADAPPDYHFHIRRAIRACVEDPDFMKAITEEDVKVGVEDVLDAACAACDTVAQALPTSDPVNFDNLATSIKAIITSLPKTMNNNAAANRFATVFIQRTRQFLTKVEPPPPPKYLPKKEPKTPEDGAPEKVHRAERASNRGKGGFREAVAAEKQQGDAILVEVGPTSAASAPIGGILGDAPVNGGSLFTAPPLGAPRGGYGRGQGILDYSSNAGYQHQQQQQPVYVNAFLPPSGLAVFKPAPDIGSRYVTLRGIPDHMASREVMKGALETIVNNGQKSIVIYFLNYEVFQQPPAEEGGAPSYYAVVSFNSNPAASEVADRVNKMSQQDGSPVTAEGSNAEEIAQFWGESRDKLEELEMQLLRQFTSIDEAKAKAVAIEARLSAIATETALADEEIKSNVAPEQKEELKAALKNRIALNREKEDLFAQRRANNESAGLFDPSSTELALPNKYSSSSAQMTNPRNVLYITDIAAPLPDQKVLLLLNRLEIEPKHIWRDEGSNTICIELHVFGAVIGALRRLDFLDGSFVNMKFTNERPRK